ADSWAMNSRIQLSNDFAWFLTKKCQRVFRLIRHFISESTHEPFWSSGVVGSLVKQSSRGQG
ncbi:MAG: hypothetical protein ACYDER_28820, partial [Ktedonobacteraceae bacterium]